MIVDLNTTDCDSGENSVVTYAIIAGEPSECHLDHISSGCYGILWSKLTLSIYYFHFPQEMLDKHSF